VVHEGGARPHAGKGTVTGAGAIAQVGAQGDAAQVVVIADAAEHDVGLRGGLARRGGTARAGGGGVFGTPGGSLGAAAVVDRDRMPGQCQMAGHGVTHHPQSEKGDSARRCGGVGLGVGAWHGAG